MKSLLKKPLFLVVTKVVTVFLGVPVNAHAVLYAAYREWSEANGERQMTGTKFGRHIGKLFDSGKDMSGKFYLGIGLVS